MLYCLICIDRENSIETRMLNREAHLNYVRETNVVKFAGPFLSEEDTMIGSLIVIDVDSKEAAESWSKNDPYRKADLFQKTEIFKFKHLI